MMLGGNPSSAPATNLLYAGEYFDTALQHYYNRARWYNPSTGSFNRMDDFAGNNQDPQSLHKYAYAHNNPVNMIDPSGEFSIISVSFALTVFATVMLMPSTTGSKWDRIHMKFMDWYKKERARGQWWTKLPKCPGPYQGCSGKGRPC